MKTWFCSTLAEDCLRGLGMIRIYGEKLKLNKQHFIQDVTNKFGKSKRNSQFLFTE